MTELVKVQPGCRVSLFYSIKFEDGTLADSNFDEEPLEFTMGDGTLQEGFELALLGQQQGTRESIKIGPEAGFGFADEEAVVMMPKSDFPEDMQIEVGSVISFDTPGGEEIPGVITEILENEYEVDLNHPFAGHELDFEYEILAIECP